MTFENLFQEGLGTWILFEETRGESVSDVDLNMASFEELERGFIAVDNSVVAIFESLRGDRAGDVEFISVEVTN